jgi:hypothetical protein
MGSDGRSVATAVENANSQGICAAKERVPIWPDSHLSMNATAFAAIVGGGRGRGPPFAFGERIRDKY